MPKHILNEKYNVQTKWLVTAKLNGNILNKFNSKINVNKAKTKGKYIIPSLPNCW